MKDLLEKLDWIFAGHKKGQKDGDQVRGTEKAKKKKRKTPYQEHPFKGRLVGSGGAAEEMEETVEQIAEQLRKELAEYGADGSGMSGYTLGRADYKNREANDRAQNAQIDQTEDDIEKQIKGLDQDALNVAKAPVGIPTRDPQGMANYAAATRQKKAQRRQIPLMFFLLKFVR